MVQSRVAKLYGNPVSDFQFNGVVDPKAIELLSRRLASKDGDLRKALYLARKAVLQASEKYCSGTLVGHTERVSEENRGAGGGALRDVLSSIVGGSNAALDGMPGEDDEEEGKEGKLTECGRGEDDDIETEVEEEGGEDTGKKPSICSCIRADGGVAWAPPANFTPPDHPHPQPSPKQTRPLSYAVTIPHTLELLAAAFESRHTRALVELPRLAQVLICAARGLVEREAAARAHTAAYERSKTEQRAGGGVMGSFEGASMSFGHLATASGAYKASGGSDKRVDAVASYGDTSGCGVSVTIGSLRDAFSRMCRKKLLASVDARDFADLLDRLEASGLVSFVGKVGVVGGGGSSSGLKGRMTNAGGDRASKGDSWMQTGVRIAVAMADLDLAFGELPFWAAISADVRRGNV